MVPSHHSGQGFFPSVRFVYQAKIEMLLLKNLIFKRKSKGLYWNGTYLGLTVLKHLQRFFNLSFIVAKFTKPITRHQISQDLQERN